MHKHLLHFVFIFSFASLAFLERLSAQVQKLPGVGDVTKVHDGFAFTEGPAYDGVKFLYFTDIPNNRIMRTDLKGNLEVFLEPSGKCNGLMHNGPPHTL